MPHHVCARHDDHNCFLYLGFKSNVSCEIELFSSSKKKSKKIDLFEVKYPSGPVKLRSMKEDY